MRIFLFGTGAMACLFAARLADAADVTLLGSWPEAIDTIRGRGIWLEDSLGSRTFRAHAEFLGTEIKPADLALVLVKSWQTGQVGRHLPQYLSPKGIVVTLQNGLGNLELLGDKALAGSTEEGATLLGPGHVRAGGSGPTHMAAPGWVIDLFRSAGLVCRRCEAHEVDRLLWSKLVVSCGINALTALLRIPNGELLKRPGTTDLMIRAAEECAAVARGKGIELSFSSPAERVREVARKTAGNQSSMLQDVLRGAPTECDAINGAVTAEGKKLGIPTPVNETLWQLLRAAAHYNRSVLDNADYR
jgi:2-dehydropantoate 2-reductase